MTSDAPFTHAAPFRQAASANAGPYEFRRLHDENKRMFGSDNYAGVHPEVMEAMAVANGGHVHAYGDDPYTASLQEAMKRHFGPSALIVPVFNGTGANVVALAQLTERWEAVVCPRTAHVNTDECGAPERMAGIKLLPVDTPDGKLTPALVDTVTATPHAEHNATPSVVTVSQTAETGALYEVEELRELVDHAHLNGMRVHMDGARLANAAVALGVGLADLTIALGVDVISLGGTKNGALDAEAVVLLDPVISRSVRYTRKLNAQLASKQRFASAQLLALYGGDLWERNARAANEAAARLAAGLADIEGARLSRPVQANAAFVVLPKLARVRLRRRWGLSDWNAATGEVRLMTSWDTTTDDVDTFLEALRGACAAG